MDNSFVRISAVMIFGIAWVIACEEVFFAGTWPGDSVTAAIVLLIPLMLQFVVLGRKRGLIHLPLAIFQVSLFFGFVLFIALLATPLLFGRPMLATLHVQVAGYRLSSSILFELAIFLIMTGSVVTALAGYKEPE